MKTSVLFNEEIEKISNCLRLELDYSFAIADRIDAILKKKNIYMKQNKRSKKRSRRA